MDDLRSFYGPLLSDSDARPSTPLRIINPADLEHDPVTEREWVVQDWLPIGCVTANYGDGGVGKTLLSQQLMTACATDTLWCGRSVMQCRSFGLFCEDDEQELHRRQSRICDHLGTRLKVLHNMRWISGHGVDNTFTTFDSAGRMHVTERFDAIATAVKDFGARLVVLDTAADLFAGNENDRGQVRRFIGLLNHLATEINGAVLLNAHPSRTGINSGNLDGGSTAWSNTVRSRWSLTRPDADADRQQLETAERVLTRRKANYASTGDSIRLRWINGAFAPVTVEGGIFGTIRRTAIEALFLDLLDRCQAQGMSLSNSRNAANFAPRAFAARTDSEGYTTREFDIAMSALFTAKKIRLVDYGRSGDTRRRIIRDTQGELPVAAQ